MSIRDAVIAQIQELIADRGKTNAPVTDNVALFDSGLDSLSIAILVARLEETLGFDPFTQSDDVFYPVTVGEFIRFYENASGAAAADSRQAG